MSELEEFKGRINILEQQRNDALNQNVILGGQLLTAIEQHKEALKTIKDLEDGNDTRSDEQKGSSGSIKRAVK
mgnify:FL=1